MPGPVVFISYSHDSDEHRERVLGLAARLRQDGLEARLDQQVNGTPEQGWPRWMLDQLDEATFVLVVCTQTYYRRFRGHEDPGRGKGADWEGSLITQEIYDKRSRTVKFVPVMLSAGQDSYIPEPLRTHTHYELTSEGRYQALYAFLLGQAGVEFGPIGQIRTPPKLTAEPLRFDLTPETPPASNIRATMIGAPRRNPHFTGRKALLSRLHQKLQEPGVGPQAPAEIHGRLGIGKTQLATEYIYEFADHYRFILWAGAESHESLRLAYLSIAREAGLIVDHADAETAVEAVNKWLSHEHRWLLVFDSVAYRDMISTYLPPTGSAGKVLFILRHKPLSALLAVSLLSTTHLTNALKIAGLPSSASIEVEVLDSDDAVKFIIERTDKADVRAAAALADELDCTPLALDQAAAYINIKERKLTEYVDEYRRQGVIIAARGGSFYRRYGEIAWELNFNAVRAASPASADLLIAASFLVPEAVPIEVFTHGGPEYGGLLSEALKGADREPLIFWSLLTPLERYSLVERSSENTFKLHSLTPLLIKRSLGIEERRAWEKRIIDAFKLTHSQLPLLKRLALTTPALNELARSLMYRDPVLQKPVDYVPARLSTLLLDPTLSWLNQWHSLELLQLRRDLAALLEPIMEAQELVLGREHPATTLTTWRLRQIAYLLNDHAGVSRLTQRLHWLLDRDESSIADADQRKIRQKMLYLKAE